MANYATPDPLAGHMSVGGRIGGWTGDFWGNPIPVYDTGPDWTNAVAPAQYGVAPGAVVGPDDRKRRQAMGIYDPPDSYTPHPQTSPTGGYTNERSALPLTGQYAQNFGETKAPTPPSTGGTGGSSGGTGSTAPPYDPWVDLMRAIYGNITGRPYGS